jgi:hypothetical protein
MENPTDIHSAEGFRRWVEAASSTHSELLELCAIGFESGRETNEPHRQLLSALPIGGDHYRLAKALASRLAALLAYFPRLDFPFPGEAQTPPGLQYEVLALVAALDCPDVLAAPLQASEAALRAAGATLPPSVRGAFAEALTRQQLAGSRLRERWLPMARGESDPLLGNSPEMGMQGLFMLPASDADAPDNPGVDRAAVGEGLLAYAGVCATDQKTRRQRFRRMVVRIRDLWNLGSVYFIQLADDYQWVEKGHEWAVDALPELFVEDFGEVGPEHQECWLVWHWFARALQPLGMLESVPKEQTLCGGRVVLVRFSDEQSTLCKDVRDRFGKLARATLEISEAEANRYVEQEIALVAQFARQQKRDSVADQLEQTRSDFLHEKQLTSGLLRV